MRLEINTYFIDYCVDLSIFERKHRKHFACFKATHCELSICLIFHIFIEHLLIRPREVASV